MYTDVPRRAVGITALLGLTACLASSYRLSKPNPDSANNLGSSSVEVNTTGLCPRTPNWRYIEGQCYLPMHALNRFYSSVLDARANCQKYGADLASFPSAKIEQAVYDELIRENALTPDLKVYIGLNDCCDNTTEDVWSWADGTIANYTSWKRGEPNNVANGNEDCVVSSKVTGWQDYPCCHKARISAVLCMRPQLGVQKDNHYVEWDPLRLACVKEKCDKKPCLNGGHCIPLPPLDFKCDCPEEFTGQRCEKEVKCEEPPAPYIQHSERVGSMSSHGATLTYICDRNHAFEGGATVKNITCHVRNHKGFWRPNLYDKHCQRLRCTAVPTWNGLIPDTKERDIGTSINYTCAEGLYFNNDTGFHLTTCDNSQQWDPPLETCAEKNPPPKIVPVPVEAAGAEAIGTVAIVFMSCEMTLFVLMDLTLISGQIGFMKENIRQFAQRL